MKFSGWSVDVRPPSWAEVGDDVQNSCDYGVSIENDTDQAQTATLHYSVQDDRGNGKSESDTLRLEPGESRSWSKSLPMWARYDQPGTVRLTGRLSSGGGGVDGTGSFTVRPKS